MDTNPESFPFVESITARFNRLLPRMDIDPYDYRV